MKECPTCRHCFPDQFNNCPTDGEELTLTIAGDTVLDGRYQLERRLGQGGMGIVYRARHIFLKTSYAIKVILPDLVGNDPGLATRFRQEAMLAARIGHRNIVNVTDFGVVGGKMPYLVMDFIQGRSLHDLLTSEGRLSSKPALEIMAAMCAGVGAAHRQGIVHRDLKPLNVMMQDGVPLSEAVKVLDFGLAKIKSGELLGSFVAAQTMGLMGSPSYMAPELWSDEEPDARADIYSLGIILFQMLAGEVPFKGPSLPSIMKKHISDKPPRFLELGVNVPPDIEKVVHHALAKKREDRMSTVEEFIDELRGGVAAADASLERISMEVTRGFVLDTSGSLNMDSATVTGAAFEELSIESQRRSDSQQRIEDEADRLNREFEEAQRRADEARSRAEEAARKRAEEEAARRHAEEEAARKLEEEETARKRAEEEARKREEEAEARRLAEVEAARKLAEEEARQRAEEEAARKRVAEEAARLAREIVEAKERAEEARLVAQSESRKRTEEEVARKRAEEEAQRLALEVAEAQRRAEEARTRAEQEAQKRAEEEDARRQAEEEEERLRDEESVRIQLAGEEARKRAAEDAHRLAREIAEAQKRAEEAGTRAQEEAQKRAEAEGARERAEEEARKLAHQMEELQIRAEESRRRNEEETAQRAAAEEQRRREEQIKHERELQEIHLSQASSAHSLSTGLQSKAIAASQSLAEETILSKAVSGAEKSSKPGPFETSVPVVAPKRSYTVPIILAVAAVVILAVIGGGAALFSKKFLGGTPTPSASPTPGPGSSPLPTKNQSVKIDGGSFMMGSNDLGTKTEYDYTQYPAHSVTVTTFWMDKTEVTNAEYSEFVTQAKYAAPNYWSNGKPLMGQEQWPVTVVSIADAKAFAEWRSKRDNVKYRLPSEEEWEYAARNGSDANLYPWGDEFINGRANVEGNSLKPVGSYPDGASRRGGVLDLIGNAWEWTSTKAALYPGNTFVEIPQGPIIIRGGAYSEKARGPEAIMATRRSWLTPTDKDAAIGFRLVHE